MQQQQQQQQQQNAERLTAHNVIDVR